MFCFSIGFLLRISLFLTCTRLNPSKKCSVLSLDFVTRLNATLSQKKKKIKKNSAIGKKDEKKKKKISLTKFYGRAWCSTTSSRSFRLKPLVSVSVVARSVCFFLIFQRERVSHELLSFLSRSISLEFSFVSCVTPALTQSTRSPRMNDIKEKKVVGGPCVLHIAMMGCRRQRRSGPKSLVMTFESDDESRHNNRRVGWVTLPHQCSF